MAYVVHDFVHTDVVQPLSSSAISIFQAAVALPPWSASAAYPALLDVQESPPPSAMPKQCQVALGHLRSRGGRGASPNFEERLPSLSSCHGGCTSAVAWMPKSFNSSFIFEANFRHSSKDTEVPPRARWRHQRSREK